MRNYVRRVQARDVFGVVLVMTMVVLVVCVVLRGSMLRKLLPHRATQNPRNRIRTISSFATQVSFGFFE